MSISHPASSTGGRRRQAGLASADRRRSAPRPAAPPAPARLWRWAFTARLHAARLDRELAEGAAPWSSPGHAARSRQLTTPRRRRALAGCLERLLADAEHGTGTVPTAAVAPCRIQVRAARPELLAIADRLRGRDPVGAGGIARLWRLLRDGSSPCYVFSDSGALARHLRAAGAALEVPG